MAASLPLSLPSAVALHLPGRFQQLHTMHPPQHRMRRSITSSRSQARGSEVQVVLLCATQAIKEPVARFVQPSPNEETDGSASASVNPFSVQSLLDTTSSERTASKALLSSTMHSHLQEEPAVKVSTPAVRRPLIESVIIANLFDEDEVAELVHFYYERLNPIIALLDSQIYTLKSLKTNPDYRILLAAICTVSSKFIKVDRYLDSLEFLKPALSRIAADDIPPQLEIIQSLSILAMWKHPKDGSSWRKVRLAITQAFELGLHELLGPRSVPKAARPDPTFSHNALCSSSRASKTATAINVTCHLPSIRACCRTSRVDRLSW